MYSSENSEFIKKNHKNNEYKEKILYGLIQLTTQYIKNNDILNRSDTTCWSLADFTKEI